MTILRTILGVITLAFIWLTTSKPGSKRSKVSVTVQESRKTNISDVNPRPTTRKSISKIKPAAQNLTPKKKCSTTANPSQDFGQAMTIGDDSELSERLESARKKVPKYLFRMWGTTSGGSALLNSTEHVTPHAFHFSSGHSSVFEMTRDHFVSTTRSHLRGNKIKNTEFSSWTASPLFVLHYASSGARSNSHIAIIDTEKLGNFVVHVPSLDQVFAPNGTLSYCHYHWEYLVHGVVKGKAYKAVSWERLLSSATSGHFPMQDIRTWPWRSPGRIPTSTEPITREELRDIWNTAQLYGWTFRVPFAISLICSKRRSFTFWEEGLTEECISMVLDVLGKGRIPDWSGSPGVMTDNIYDPRYEDNRQMLVLMRALNARCHGTGVQRGVAPQAPQGGLTRPMTIRQRLFRQAVRRYVQQELDGDLDGLDETPGGDGLE